MPRTGRPRRRRAPTMVGGEQRVVRRLASIEALLERGDRRKALREVEPALTDLAQVRDTRTFTHAAGMLAGLLADDGQLLGPGGAPAHLAVADRIEAVLAAMPADLEAGD